MTLSLYEWNSLDYLGLYLLDSMSIMYSDGMLIYVEGTKNMGFEDIEFL